MAEETDIEALRRAVTDLAVSVKETNETTRVLVETARGQISSSNTTIHAGGISAGIAIGVAAFSVALVFLGGVWLMLNLDGVRKEMTQTRQDLQDQQSAWVSVMQQRVNEAKNAAAK
jgi:hypothetical protein